MKLAALGEFGLINRIAAQVGVHGGVRCGIGDDAAALVPSDGTVQLVTSDMLLEGIHFDLAYSYPETLGRKSLAVNLSDMGAMGGRPRWFLLSLGLPPETDTGFLDPFITGMLEMADRYHVALVGGDTCGSKSGLVISITLIGEQLPEKVQYRNGAAPGDLVCVTGTLGDSALGLMELRAGVAESPAVNRHLDPVPRCREGLLLAEAGIPSSMIDLSDGLLADLGHILQQSGVGARLDLEKLPVSPYFREQSGRYFAAPLQPALSGGEDYELLFTVPPDRRPEVDRILAAGKLPVTAIGEITSAGGLKLLSHGAPYQADCQGFRHF